MKSRFALLSIVALLLCSILAVLCSCNQKISPNDTPESQPLNVPSVQDGADNTVKQVAVPRKLISVFERALPDTPASLQTISVTVEGDEWRFANSVFTARETAIAPTTEKAAWKVDLSKLNAIGKSGNYLFYGTDAIIEENEILVVQFSKSLILLVQNEGVLEPDVYGLEDFSIENTSDALSEAEANKLWEDHLGGQYSISTLTTEELPQYLRLRLQAHPELVYEVVYDEYEGHYYTPSKVNWNE